MTQPQPAGVREAPAPPEQFRKVAAEWSPPAIETEEFVTPGPATALAGLFDQPSPVSRAGDVLPPLWHWLYLLDRLAQRDLGSDGHPREGALLPPLADRRRMFAGGRLSFREPIRCGRLLRRIARVSAVHVKPGRSGWLLLVTVAQELSVDGRLCVVEEQDLVYKQEQPAGPPPVASAQPASSAQPGLPAAAAAAPTVPAAGEPGEPGWGFSFTPDPMLLFRFSALTYNAHRIHYDRAYATEAEGYPDLVVHGPLLALAVLELPRRFAPDRAVRGFSYRARQPLFSGGVIDVGGEPQPGAPSAALWARRPGQAAAFGATATFG